MEFSITTSDDIIVSSPMLTLGPIEADSSILQFLPIIVPVQIVLKFPTDELSPIVTPASITVYAPMVTLLPRLASPLT